MKNSSAKNPKIELCQGRGGAYKSKSLRIRHCWKPDGTCVYCKKTREEVGYKTDK